MHRWCVCPRCEAVISRITSVTAKMTANIANGDGQQQPHVDSAGQVSIGADVGESWRTSSPRSSKPFMVVRKRPLKFKFVH